MLSECCIVTAENQLWYKPECVSCSTEQILSMTQLYHNPVVVVVVVVVVTAENQLWYKPECVSSSTEQSLRMTQLYQ